MLNNQNSTAVYIRLLLPILVACLIPSQLTATSADTLGVSAPRMIEAIERHDSKIHIDGRLDEKLWSKAHFTSSFTQRNPDEGTPATEETEVAFAYDNDALYVACRMYSPEPDNIQTIISRRDRSGNSERIIISVDTYLDRRTAYSFSVTASGTRTDYYHPSDNQYHRDYSFDPVWNAAVQRDSLGWTAEMRIPFSQLRFSNSKNQLWGLNINRYIPHKNEDDYWIHIPKNKTGWTSRFGLLTGINGIEPSRRFEIIPYMAGSSSITGDPDEANPFSEKVSWDGRFGGNLKLGLGSNLTLNATVNPDFGQVEADPANVNLSAYETYFDEKRPFFTEGSQMLSGGGATYFYSRRIGGAPPYHPDGDYVDISNNTSILGAAKLTGRLPSGLSVGGLTAVTGKEFAKVYVDSTDRTRETIAAPLTSYGVTRLQQEFGDYASTAGFILTGVQRNISDYDSLIYNLHETAVTGGADWNIRFNEGMYELSGDAGFSYVKGSRNAILQTQHSSTHYYQRPDVDYISVDSSRTSMTGFRGSLEFEKNSGEHWLWEIGGLTESPEFQINDLGIVNDADEFTSNGHLRYREIVPTSWYHNYNIWVGYWAKWDYGGNKLGRSYDIGGELQFPSFWNINFHVGYNPRTYSKSQTRGGPLMGNPQTNRHRITFGTNRSLSKYGRIRVNYNYDEFGGYYARINTFFEMRVGNRWEISLRPEYMEQINKRQYITTLDNGPEATYDNRYIFSTIKRQELSVQLRVNFAFTPNLTIDAYAEPFTSNGDYYDPGELPAARSYALDRYGDESTEQIIERNGTYHVDKGANSFSFDNPDFLVRSFRSNLVLRYQWRPGSTFFLVWQQNKFVDQNDPYMDPADIARSITETGDNVIAVKFNYWFNVD